jgi:hypothetical protein
VSVSGDPAGYPETCTVGVVTTTLTDLVDAVSSGEEGTVADLLADVEGGAGVAAELVGTYGPGAPAPLAWAQLVYGDSPSEVGLSLSTTGGGGGPQGRFGCESGSLTALIGG